ncbi:MAG: anti-phage ZorAB system protein ZorA [Candidatus Gastranaerophilales bacterium]|nr:anti-phage ZorAB system protein ZorA [Candidatus Gastranaerophilales bacterium]
MNDFWFGSITIGTFEIPNIVLSCIIVAIATFSWSTYYLKNRSTELKRSLKNVLHRLNDYLSEITPQEKEDIKDVFEKEKFSGKTYLRDIWQEFEETLEVLKDASGKTIVYNTIQAEHFFNRNTVIKPNIKLDILNAVPGILTSIGLLGTFIAILFGLYHVKVQVGGAVTGIDGLINGLSGKFLSSIVALTLSIIFTVIERWEGGELDRSSVAIYNKLNKIFPRKSTEKVLLQILRHSEEQSAALKHFSTDLSGHLKESVREGLAPTLEKLIEGLNELRKEKQESSTQAISGMVQEFKSALMGSAYSEMETLAATMSSVSSTLNNFDQTNKAFEERIQIMMENLDNTIRHQQEQAETQFDKFKEVLEIIDNKFATFREIIEKTEQVHKEFDRVSGEIAYASENFAEASGSFKQINEAVKQLTDVSSEYQNQLSRSVEAWDGHKNTVKQLEESLNNILNNVHNSLVNYSNQTNNSLKDYLNQYDGHMANVNNKLGISITDLEEKLDSLSEVFEKGFTNISNAVQNQIEAQVNLNEDKEEEFING